MRFAFSLIFVLPALGISLLVLAGCSSPSVANGTGTPVIDPTVRPDTSSVQESSVLSFSGRTLDEIGLKAFTDAVEPGIFSSAPISVSQVPRQSSLPLGCILPLKTSFGFPSPSSAMIFPNSVTVTINLDDQTSGSNPYPNATGTLTLVGQRTAFNPLGTASYSIVLTTSSTVTLTTSSTVALTTSSTVANIDRWTTIVPSGTTRTMDLRIIWQGIGPLQNTITVSATGAQTTYPLTLTKGSTTIRGSVLSENWAGGFTRTRNASVVTYGNLSFTGTRIVEWTNSSNATIRVTWDVKSLNEIYLTIVPALHTEPYGPYTAQQILDQFGTTIEYDKKKDKNANDKAQIRTQFGTTIE